MSVPRLLTAPARKRTTLSAFLAPHELATDSRSALYVGEVSWTNWPQTFKDEPRPDNLRSLRKFRKMDSGAARARA
jgi:hypothetical protein